MHHSLAHDARKLGILDFRLRNNYIDCNSYICYNPLVNSFFRGPSMDGIPPSTSQQPG